jgi:hypothetical protein
MWYLIRYLRRRQLHKQRSMGRQSAQAGGKASAAAPVAAAALKPRKAGAGARVWQRLVPFAACAVFLAASFIQPPWFSITLVIGALVAAVLVSVHHAEVVISNLKVV